MNIAPIPKSVGVATFRSKISAYLDKAEEEPVILSRGEKQYIVVEIDMYNHGRMRGEEFEEAIRRERKRKLLEKLKKHGPFHLKVERYKDWEPISFKE